MKVELLFKKQGAPREVKVTLEGEARTVWKLAETVRGYLSSGWNEL